MARRTGLIDNAVEQLSSRIVSGEWGVGTRIPPEPALVELLVADVDADHERLGAVLADLGAGAVAAPMTMPWGNRSLLLRDPDGTLVNLFTPVTPESIAKFRG